ncbi:MAG: hypothetical protein LBU81_00915 [Methanosarcinales archaeon]|jgi:hypothetical protein|nr:hypothetical protein [Methanosarcinales archaeon]
MERSDIEDLKLSAAILDLIDQGFSFPLNEFSEIVHSMETYRFGHDVESSEFKNHETTYERDYMTGSKQPDADVLYCCALSCYTSKDSAESELIKILERHKKYRLKLGNSLLYGLLNPEDGFVNKPDHKTHFDFFQKKCCDMKSNFKLFKILKPSGE